MMVRTSTYNTILAKAKRGMKFEKDDSDTWVLVQRKKLPPPALWRRWPPNREST